MRGNCLNLSESGLLAIFDTELDLWDQGLLVLEAGEFHHTQPSRVARVNERETGLSFMFRDEAQRNAIRDLLEIAAKTPHLVGAPPF